MNYRDKYSRYHDKPVTDSNPIPSNNGFLYTAYAVKAGLAVDQEKLQYCFDASKIQLGKRYEILRSPGKSTPPLSRDEVLGLAALKLLEPKHLNGWNFSPYKLPKFNLFSLVKQLLQLRGQHRNYFWEKRLDQVYRFAFSVPFADRHFILKKWGMFKFYNPVHVFYAAFGKLQSEYKPNAIDWLKYGGKGVESLKEEFPEGHPIRKELGL